MLRGSGDDAKTQIPRWEPCGVGLNGVLRGVDEANESVPRANPVHGIP